jgi:hypothetical protein
VILGDGAMLTLKICVEKITKIYSRQGAASKMFRDTCANIQFPVMLISHFELHILPKVTKTVGILAKTH